MNIANGRQQFGGGAAQERAGPGTYLATLRVTSNREGDPATPFANVPNLGQVRVVVHRA